MRRSFSIMNRSQSSSVQYGSGSHGSGVTGTSSSCIVPQATSYLMPFFQPSAPPRPLFSKCLSPGAWHLTWALPFGTPPVFLPHPSQFRTVSCFLSLYYLGWPRSFPCYHFQELTFLIQSQSASPAAL